VYHEVFSRLGLKGYSLRINHRKILAALAEQCGGIEKLSDITVAIDKLDKIGIEKVKAELEKKGIEKVHITTIEKFLAITGNDDEKLSQVKTLLGNSTTGAEGIRDIEFLLTAIYNANLPIASVANLSIDLTLARGLNYYTGIIFEAKAPAEIDIGSIGGGGRYDDLTGLFGVPGIPGVGISFGVDRIYDVMEEMNLFPPDVNIGTQVLFFNLGEKESQAAFRLVQQLRQQGIRSELYHENQKFDKQFKYAERKNIPYVIIIGEKELSENTCNVKNLATGKQDSVAMKDLFQYNFQPL
jgi:histidyl-tRNA synthetase